MDPLIVPGILDSLGPIREYVKAVAVSAGLDPDAAYSLMLAVDELATNAVTHGYLENGLSGNITIRAESAPEELAVAIEDTAPPFDPRTHRTPEKEELDKALEERPVGGLGVFLALQGVDRLDYERVNERNRVILVMKRGGTPARPGD
jgi:anti-sigma regulatory factor (Ser/Thr protein kinase)